ncbi:MAG: hypothetical protein K8F26_14210, partial [Thiobacillus sp.]|nr:hypothetical protein [Thiobacillus sp.]
GTPGCSAPPTTSPRSFSRRGRTPNVDASSGNQRIERLERTETLRKKCLISDGEYKQLQIRVPG